MKVERDVTELIALMIERKVLRLEMGSLKLELHPSAFANISDLPATEKIGIEHGQPTADELLYWSAGGHSDTAPKTPDIVPEVG